MPESQEEVPDSRNGYAECQELEQLDLRPITLDDIRANPDRERLDDSPIIEWKKRDHFLPAVLGKRKRVTKLHSEHNLWNRALSKVSSLGDTWENFDVEGVKTEHATRHRYKAVTCSWITDTVILKIETQSFNSGAMRRCFRTKKLSNFSHGEGWHKDSNNYVAKEYMVPVQRSTYFDDVKLQQEAKLWGEEFNRHNPPKKVDIMQMCVVEMSDRPDKPLFHLEHYIEGHYVKYNSNSGFVRDENLRLTPQAFSHFTFERSGHELVVVDVQGVGDLYTDPQIHTADGLSYGDGNLGTRGMALFFHSHVCNVICRGLGLTEFDLASTENKELSVQIQQQVSTQFDLASTENKELSGQIQQQRRCKTVTRGLEEMCASPREHAFDLHQYLRRRSSSSGCWSDAGDATSPGVEPSSPPPFHNESSDSTRDSFLSKRIRFVSESSTSSNEAGDRVRFQDIISNKQRPSNIEAELDRIGSVAAPSILGLIHFDLAKYHEVGRFLAADHRDEYDRTACLFHLERAVDCGVLPAIVTAADLYLGRPHDLLSDIQVDDTVENRRRGVSLLERAAEAGDRPSMVELARCCELGTYLQERRDWSQAVRWYKRAVETESEETRESDEPSYLLLGKAAHLLRTGGPNLEPDFSRAAELYTAAAEQASAAMQGRTANKYFMAADECWALCDDDDEEEEEEE